MFVPNWEENAHSIEYYMNNNSFFKCRKAEEICSILDAKQLKPDSFDLLFNNISTYHDKHTILDIISHANVEYSNNISEILVNINTLFHALKIPLFMKMSKSIDSIFQNTLNNAIDEIKHKYISFEYVKIKESELNDLKESFIAETDSEKERTDELISRLRDLEDAIARVTDEINSLRKEQAAKEALLHDDIASMQSELEDLENDKEAESALNSFLDKARDLAGRLKHGDVDEISLIANSVTASIDDFIIDHIDQPQYVSKAESIKTTINDAIDSLISSKEQVFSDVDSEDDYDEDSVVEEPGIDTNNYSSIAYNMLQAAMVLMKYDSVDKSDKIRNIFKSHHAKRPKFN